MEALPLPVLADPAPEIDPRRVWATIARSAWLILGCVLLALAAGAVAVRRMEPVYQSTASIRIDSRPGTTSAAAMYGLPTDNVNLVATAIEELNSRSLSNDVVDSLGLRLVVGEPQRMPRSAVLAWAKVDAGRAAPRLPADAVRRQAGERPGARRALGRQVPAREHDRRAGRDVPPGGFGAREWRRRWCRSRRSRPRRRACARAPRWRSPT